MFYVLTRWKDDQNYSRRSTSYKYEGKAVRVAKDLFGRNHYDSVKVINDNQEEMFFMEKYKPQEINNY